MILSDKTILDMVVDNRLGIAPLDRSQIQPASVDIRLGNTFSIVEDFPDGGIAVAITVNGEPRLTSKGIFVPAAAGDNYGNVTSTAIIKVPKGCCFSLSVDAVPASSDPTVTPAPAIAVQNANFVINRIA